jgi:hypothetical protein
MIYNARISLYNFTKFPGVDKFPSIHRGGKLGGREGKGWIRKMVE